MASQTSGRNIGEQDAVKETPNRSERRPGTSPPDFQALRASWNRLQLVNQQVAATYREWHEAQNFLWANVDALMSYHGILERRCGGYYHEMHTLATKNIALQEELEKANESTDAAVRRARELDAVSTHLAERNVSLQQDLDEAHREFRAMEVSSRELVGVNLALQQDLYRAHDRIHILGRRVAGADPPPADASGSENKAHELDADRKSPDVIITELRAKLTAMEGEDKMVEESKSAPVNAFEPTSVAENKFKQSEDRENCLDNQETDSTILVASKGASPSPGDGGGPNAGESKTNAVHGKRRPCKRGKGRPRKLGPTNPGLGIVCG